MALRENKCFLRIQEPTIKEYVQVQDSSCVFQLIDHSPIHLHLLDLTNLNKTRFTVLDTFSSSLNPRIRITVIQLLKTNPLNLLHSILPDLYCSGWSAAAFQNWIGLEMTVSYLATSHKRKAFSSTWSFWYVPDY